MSHARILIDPELLQSLLDYVLSREERAFFEEVEESCLWGQVDHKDAERLLELYRNEDSAPEPAETKEFNDRLERIAATPKGRTMAYAQALLLDIDLRLAVAEERRRPDRERIMAKAKSALTPEEQMKYETYLKEYR